MVVAAGQRQQGWDGRPVHLRLSVQRHCLPAEHAIQCMTTMRMLRRDMCGSGRHSLTYCHQQLHLAMHSVCAPHHDLHAGCKRATTHARGEVAGSGRV